MRTRQSISAASQQTPAAAPAAPAPAPAGDLVAVCGRGPICTRGAATRSVVLVKNPENANDCDKETGRGCLVRVQAERLFAKAGWRTEWLALDGTATSFILHVPIGDGTTELEISGHLYHGQNTFDGTYKPGRAHVPRRVRADAFFVPMRVALDDAGGFAFEFHADAHGVPQLHVYCSAPWLAVGLVSRRDALLALRAYDAPKPRSARKWTALREHSGAVEFHGGSMGCVPVPENSETPSTYYGKLHAIDATCSTNFHTDLFVHVGRRSWTASASSSGAWPAPRPRRRRSRTCSLRTSATAWSG